MEEIWKDIEGYEGYFQISNFGKVKSVQRIIWIEGKKPRYKNIRERILKTWKNNSGYEMVALYINGIKKDRTVHRLVARAFIPNENKLPDVNHKNGLKFDNCVENLEWITKGNNEKHKRQKIQNKKRGVRWHTIAKKWVAEIGVCGKYYYLGLFVDKEAAYNAFYNKYVEAYGVVPWTEEKNV